jgi:hypothetical protein
LYLDGKEFGQKPLKKAPWDLNNRKKVFFLTQGLKYFEC